VRQRENPFNRARRSQTRQDNNSSDTSSDSEQSYVTTEDGVSTSAGEPSNVTVFMVSDTHSINGKTNYWLTVLHIWFWKIFKTYLFNLQANHKSWNIQPVVLIPIRWVYIRTLNHFQHLFKSHRHEESSHRHAGSWQIPWWIPIIMSRPQIMRQWRPVVPTKMMLLRNGLTLLWLPLYVMSCSRLVEIFFREIH